MKSAGCVCSKNRSIGRSAGSVSAKITKPADGPMFPRRPADFNFCASAGRFSEFPPLACRVHTFLCVI